MLVVLGWGPEKMDAGATKGMARMSCLLLEAKTARSSFAYLE
jgi:hypothetical protein